MPYSKITPAATGSNPSGQAVSSLASAALRSGLKMRANTPVRSAKLNYKSP